MLRIAFLTREFPRLTPWGGISNFYTHMAHSLKNREHHVEIFAQGFHGEYDEVVEGITVHRVQAKHQGKYLQGMNGDDIPFHVFTRSLAQQIAQSFLKRHKQVRFDVIEAHEHLGISAYLPRSTCPVFLTGFTSLAVFYTFPENQFQLNGSIVDVAAQEYDAHLKADRIRFLSQDLLERTCRIFPGIEHKSTVVFNPCGIPERISYHAFHDAPRSFLFIGRLEPRKGAQLIPDALKIVWQSFPDVTVSLIGQDCFYPSFRGTMREYITTTLGDRARFIQFLDWRPKHELDQLIQEYPYILVPSLYDNSPYSAQESMALGRCVLCSDAGGTKEYVGDCGYVFRVNDPKALAQAMLDALHNAHHNLELGQRAATRAADLFDRDKFAARFVAEVVNAVT